MNAILRFLSCLLFVYATHAAEQKMNVVFILADDFGWTGFGCYGGSFYETPNVDKLARKGMKFTQAYSACAVCSPTRAAIMTGKFPARLRVTDFIPGENWNHAKLTPPAWTKRLPEGEITIAHRLKSAGYVCGSVGKWHLGQADGRPEHFGFDFSVAGIGRGSPASYFSPYKNSFLKDGPKGEYLTDRITKEALNFIEANQAKPFFLYLPHFAVHTPIQAKPEAAAKYQKKSDPSAPHHHPAYAAMVESLDESVGQVLQKLEELKLAERTIVILTADNGGYLKYTTNAPLRAGKASYYEGGIRVPLLVRWPGVTKAGSVCEAPVISMDFYPTLLEMLGVKDDGKHICDGESIVPLLKQAGALKRKQLYWHYPHYNTNNPEPSSTIRDGDWKLIQFHEDGRTELYNLRNDLGETKNLANELPGRAGELMAKLDSWRRTVGAQMPLPNPHYDPARWKEKFRTPIVQ